MLRDAFIKLIESPTQENYLRIRQMILDDETYQPCSQGQSLTHKDEMHFHVLTTKDGKELWFDVTAAYERMGGEMGG